MADATLTGKTMLDTSGMRKGFMELRRSLRLFRRDVMQPLGDTVSALNRVIRYSTLAASAIAGIGIRESFKLTGVEEQFAVLMKNSELAKQRVKELTELAANTPFDLGPYVNAAKTLYAIGGEDLSNNTFLTKLGDTAAAMSVDIEQAAIWIGKFYNSLRSGSGVGTSGDDLMRAGILRADTYSQLIKLTRAGADFGEVWQLAMGDLDRFNGGMERLSKTGRGQLAVFRGLVSLGMAELFDKVSERFKDVIFQLNEILKKIREDGTLERWAANIGNAIESVVNFIWRLVTAWRNLNINTRKELQSLLVSGSVVLLAFKTGLLGPLIQSVAGLVPAVVRVIGSLASFLGPALAGLGKYIVAFFHLPLTSILGLAPLILGAVGLLFVGIKNILDKSKDETVRNIESFWIVTKSTILKGIMGVKAILTGILIPIIGFDEAKKIFNEMDREAKKLERDQQRALRKEYFRRTGQWDELQNMERQDQESGIENPLEKSWLSALVPDALKEFWEEFQKLGNIKFPQMPPLEPLDEALHTKQALNDVKKLRSTMADFTLRGIYARLPRLQSMTAPLRFAVPQLPALPTPAAAVQAARSVGESRAAEMDTQSLVNSIGSLIQAIGDANGSLNRLIGEPLKLAPVWGD